MRRGTRGVGLGETEADKRRAKDMVKDQYL